MCVHSVSSTIAAWYARPRNNEKKFQEAISLVPHNLLPKKHWIRTSYKGVWDGPGRNTHHKLSIGLTFCLTRIRRRLELTRSVSIHNTDLAMSALSVLIAVLALIATGNAQATECTFKAPPGSFPPWISGAWDCSSSSALTPAYQGLL